MLERTVSRIMPLDEEAMSKCQERLDNLIKPLNSLGAFEMLARKMAGVTGLPRPKMLQSSLVLAAGDKSVPSSTAQVFAAHVGARLVWFDAGKGRGNSRGGMLAAIESGIRIAQVEVAKGSRILGLGTLGNNISAADSIIKGNRVGVSDPVAMLVAAESPVIAGLAGVILGAAAERAAVVLDDAATLAGALVAVELAPLAGEYLVGSHFSAERGSEEAIRLLGMQAYLKLGMNLGEGTGAALGISLLKASMHVLNDMKTFGDAAVPVAEDGPGALVQNPDVRD